MANTNPDQQPRRRGRVFGQILLIVVFIAIGGVIGVLAFTQLSSFRLVDESLDLRLSSNSDLLFAKDNELAIEIANLTSSVNALSSESSRLSSENEALESTIDEMSALIAAQAEALTTLEEGQATVNGRVDEVDAVGQSTTAAAETLQGDLDSLNQTLDTVATGLTTLESTIGSIEGDLLAVQNAQDEQQAILETIGSGEEVIASDVDADSGEATVVIEQAPAVDLSTELAILRLSGLVMRTKLHLAESDVEAAATSLGNAQALADALNTADDGAYGEGLIAVGEALAAAETDLDGKIALANLSLDDALDAIDTLLASVVTP